MAFVERQRGEPGRLFWGAYAQTGHLFGTVEPIVRVEIFDRNSTTDRGLLLLGAAGVTIYVSDQNLKVQFMYQGTTRLDYASEVLAHQDDATIADHTGVIQLQFVL